MISLWMLLTVAAVVGVGFAGFSYLSLIPAIIAAVVGIPAAIWLLALGYGLWRRSQPLRPFDAAEHQKNAERLGATGRHITTADGRVVEYLVYGSKQPDAKVIVQMHGQGCTAGSMSRWYASLCEELNLKGIAPSTPGNGYSDIHVGRRIVDFPLDLEVILEAEGVGEFMVEGMSLGTPHAMAIALHFGPDRCVAMGLNVPYLPEPICKEFDLRHDADYLPRPDARTWYQAWNFVVADLVYLAPLISPPGRQMHRLPEGKAVQKDRPWTFEMLTEDTKRTVVRGSQGQGYEWLSYDLMALWGFDPREIETKNIAIWYAKDDSQSPPSHGEWLAKQFSSKPGVQLSVRSEELGFGHFTYGPALGPEFRATEESMPKTLLSLLALRES